MNERIQELLNKELRTERELGELTYGSPEIRNGRFIYTHYREEGRQVTRYVGEYSDELYNLILKNNQTAKKLKKELKQIRHELHEQGYNKSELSEKVKRNLDFAKRNLALTIHSQAILEGVATTFAETEAIIEGARVQGMTEKDIRKIVNMKHAWEFIMDDNVITAPNNIALLRQVNKLVEEGFYFNAGHLRDVPVNIGGTVWRPDLPIESKITEELAHIISTKSGITDRAINLALYIMRSQIFLDGNKRTAIIFANHFLIQKGAGLLYVPEEKTNEFKKLLVNYYETNQKTNITRFIKQHCLLVL